MPEGSLGKRQWQGCRQEETNTHILSFINSTTLSFPDHLGTGVGVNRTEKSLPSGERLFKY